MSINLQPYRYNIEYGKDSRADAGMVMFELHDGDKLVVLMQIPAETYLDIAHSVENVARAVEADLYPT